MKKYIFLCLAVLPLAGQTVLADISESKEPDHASLPHAFVAGWDGQKTCEVVFEDETMLVGRCIFPPGVGHEQHYHNPHFGYVLEGGTLRIQDDRGERKVTTTADGTWSTNSVTVHEAFNIGDTTTSYLIVEPKSP
jgi:quercetin dioxygenase-like cupin family protein